MRLYENGVFYQNGKLINEGNVEEGKKNIGLSDFRCT